MFLCLSSNACWDTLRPLRGIGNGWIELILVKNKTTVKVKSWLYLVDTLVDCLQVLVFPRRSQMQAASEWERNIGRRETGLEVFGGNWPWTEKSPTPPFLFRRNHPSKLSWSKILRSPDSPRGAVLSLMLCSHFTVLGWRDEKKWISPPGID